MDPKQFFKALIAGMAFPSLMLPLFCSMLYFMNPNANIVQVEKIATMFVPLLFGIANAVFISLKTKFHASQHNNLLIATGVILGAVISLLHIPTIVLSAFPTFSSYALIILPVFYALIFRFIIKWINKLLHV